MVHIKRTFVRKFRSCIVYPQASTAGNAAGKRKRIHNFKTDPAPGCTYFNIRLTSAGILIDTVLQYQLGLLSNRQIPYLSYNIFISISIVVCM